MENKIAENLHIADLIYSHLLGRLSQSGEEELTQWARGSAENRRLLDSLENRDSFLRQWRKFNAFDREEGWKRLQEKVPALRMMAYDGTYHGPAEVKVIPAGRHLIQRHRRIGALAFGFVLLLFFIGYRYRWWQTDALCLALGYEKTYLEKEGQPTVFLASYPPETVLREGAINIRLEKNQLILQAENTQPEAPDNLLTVHTVNGGRCSMSMPDGSKVHLNAASYVQFATYYGRPQREVNLDGEGYFEIKTLQSASASHRKIPFIVHVIRPASMRALNQDSSLLTITATGTVFNIKAYDNDSSIRTTLLSGTLDVQRAGDSAIHLTQGDSYVLNQNGSHRIQTNEWKEAIGWTDGDFIFRDRPLDEILRELARTYDVKVEYLDKPPGTFRLRGNKSEPLKTILDRLQGANHAHFVTEDSKIIVSMSH